jgi:ATP-binding cassette subfamily C protein/ATP-binding cassette subfamily C protein EexD
MLTTALYMMQVYDRVLTSRSTDTLLFLTLAALLALLLLAVLEAVRMHLGAAVGQWAAKRLAPRTLTLSIEGRLRGRLRRTEALRELGQVRSFLGSPALFALFDAPWIPVFLATVFMLHPWLGALALLAGGLLFVLAVANEKAIRQPAEAAAAAAARAFADGDALIRNAEVIDSMGMGDGAARRWGAALEEELEHARHATWRGSLILSTTKFLRLATQVGMLGVGAVLVLRQELSPGAMIAGSILLSRMLAPIEGAIGNWRQLVLARRSLQRLEEFFDDAEARPLGMALPPPQGTLEAESVVFVFPGMKKPVIRNVSFRVEPGQVLSIIGPSASGKSTLARLLVGVYRPASGNVRLDSADVFHWRRDDFGRYVGYLPQEVELFNGTVRDNIARFSDADDSSVVAAARLAGCHDMILRLGLGYDTEIGDGGMFLSGGQRQRIGLARALFGNPKLVVLDEPDASLDSAGESALLAAVEELKGRATVVIVSHRPSLVRSSDVLVVLKEGAIDLAGPTSEILDRVAAMAVRPLNSPQRKGKGAQNG